MRRLLHAGGALAAIRLAAVPVLWASERFVEHPTANAAPFTGLLTLFAVYAVVTALAELRGRPVATPMRLAVVDLVLVTALVATSGGPESSLRYAFFVVPVCAALLLRPGVTAQTSLAGVVAYALIAVTYPEDADTTFVVVQLLMLVWLGAAATLLSALLAARTREVAELASDRQRLVAQAISAEEVARQRLAGDLHDGALQSVLAARQLLGDPGAEDLVRRGLDDAAAQLRSAVRDLHPHLLEQGGLPTALRAIVEQASHHGLDALADADDSAAGVHDALLFSVARELVANVVRHAGASTLRVTLAAEDEHVVLVVADDGRGADPSQVAAAALDGHIGLASCVERVQAAGGTLELRDGPDGRGTTVRVRLPRRAGVAAVA